MSRREIYACDCCENEIIIKNCQNKKKTDFKIRLRRINMEQWDEEEVWDAISVISSIRAKCSVFKREQRSKYHACSMAIRALREVIGDSAAMDKVTDSSLIYELDSRGYNVDNLIEILHKIKS